MQNLEVVMSKYSANKAESKTLKVITENKPMDVVIPVFDKPETLDKFRFNYRIIFPAKKNIEDAFLDYMKVYHNKLKLGKISFHYTERTNSAFNYSSWYGLPREVILAFRALDKKQPHRLMDIGLYKQIRFAAARFISDDPELFCGLPLEIYTSLFKICKPCKIFFRAYTEV